MAGKKESGKKETAAGKKLAAKKEKKDVQSSGGTAAEPSTENPPAPAKVKKHREKKEKAAKKPETPAAPERLTPRRASKILQKYALYHVTPKSRRANIVLHGLHFEQAIVPKRTPPLDHASINVPADVVRNNAIFTRIFTRAVEEKFNEACGIAREVRKRFPRDKVMLLHETHLSAVFPNATPSKLAYERVWNADDILRIFDRIQQQKVDGKVVVKYKPPPDRERLHWFHKYDNFVNFCGKWKTSKVEAEVGSPTVWLIPEEYQKAKGYTVQRNQAITTGQNVPPEFLVCGEKLPQSGRLFADICRKEGFEITQEEAERMIPLVLPKDVPNEGYNARELEKDEKETTKVRHLNWLEGDVQWRDPEKASKEAEGERKPNDAKRAPKRKGSADATKKKRAK